MYQDPPPSYSQAIAVEQHIPSAPLGEYCQHTKLHIIPLIRLIRLRLTGESGPEVNNTPYNPYYVQPPLPTQQQINNKTISLPVPNNPVNSPTNIIITTQVIDPNLCPSCRIGILEYDYTCLGICCAIVFFPLGILCCLAMRNRRCLHCDSQF